MKRLFFLYILLGLWIVALGDEHKYVSPTPICKSDGEILVALSGDKLPFTFETVGSSVDNTDIKAVCIAPLDKPNTQIGAFFIDINDAYLAIQALCNSKGCIDSIFFIASEPLIVKINLWSRFCLSESGHGYHGENKYEKKPFHGANITING